MAHQVTDAEALEEQLRQLVEWANFEQDPAERCRVIEEIRCLRAALKREPAQPTKGGAP